MNTIDENLIDELIGKAKAKKDLSVWQKKRDVSTLLKLINKLNDFPKTQAPQADFARIRGQILDRISVKTEELSNSRWPKVLKIFAGALGGFLIIVSLVLGTAAAAWQSGPGDAIYPLKKIVENIELKFAANASEKASLQIRFANNRLDELQDVLQKQQEGQLSAAETQKIVSATVSDLQKTTAAAVSASNTAKPKPAILNNIVALTDKQSAVLKSASIQTGGQAKADVEQALVATAISRDEAIKNIENAGLKVEDQPISTDGVTARGKLTAVSGTSISVGTFKFFLDKDTKFINGKAEDLKVDVLVSVSGKINDNKTYATVVTLVIDATQ